MKTFYIGTVWLIGVSAIFICMLAVFKIKNYFPFGLLAAYVWSFLIYKATNHSPKEI